MTSFQKALLGTAVFAAVAISCYKIHEASGLRAELESLRQRQIHEVEQIDRLTREHQEALAGQESAIRENEVLKKAVQDLPKLRAELKRLQDRQPQSSQARADGVDLNDPFTQSVISLTSRAVELNRRLEQMPDKKIPELGLLTTDDWLRAAREAEFGDDASIRKALSRLRALAKDKLPIGSALYSFTRANNGQLPTDLSQLQPFFKSPVDDAVLDRYTLLRSGNINDLPNGAWLIVEKAPVDKDYDSRAKFGVGTSTIISTGIGQTGDPEDKNY